MDTPIPRHPVYVKASEIKRLVKSKGKRAGKDFVAYCNERVEHMVLNYIHITGSKKTLRALDCITLDEFNRHRR